MPSLLLLWPSLAPLVDLSIPFSIVHGHRCTHVQCWCAHPAVGILNNLCHSVNVDTNTCWNGSTFCVRACKGRYMSSSMWVITIYITWSRPDTFVHDLPSAPNTTRDITRISRDHRFSTRICVHLPVFPWPTRIPRGHSCSRASWRRPDTLWGRQRHCLPGKRPYGSTTKDAWCKQYDQNAEGKTRAQKTVKLGGHRWQEIQYS